MADYEQRDFSYEEDVVDEIDVVNDNLEDSEGNENPLRGLDTLECFSAPLRKHAYSNTLKSLPPKHSNFSDKKFWYFHISAQNIDCWYSLEPPREGGSNEYPQSMFLSRNDKNNVYPCKPQFYYIKLGFKGVKII